jgi:hypothetical protein
VTVVKIANAKMRIGTSRGARLRPSSRGEAADRLGPAVFAHSNNRDS